MTIDEKRLTSILSHLSVTQGLFSLNNVLVRRVVSVTSPYSEHHGHPEDCESSKPVATGDPSETCCNICPSDKPPEGDIFAHFKPNSGGAGNPPATQVPSFLEIISGSSIKSKDPGDVNVMGPSMVCCPVCPTLQELSHGPMEPLGGIFGEGKVGTQGTLKAES